MLKKVGLIAGAAMLALGLGTSGAFADDCSGHGHAGGTVLGALLGGAIGSAASHGNAGAVVGGDRAGRAYHDSFYGDVGHRYEWEGHDRGYIVTTREYRRHGRLCRDFEQVVYRHGRDYTREGTACLRHGDWVFES